MTEIADFNYANNFWGEKHLGYQVLYEHAKRGEDSISEMMHFVKERVTMEEEYNKMLLKSASRVNSFITNHSRLESSWNVTKGTLELLAEIHVMMVKNLQDLMKEISRYKDEHSKIRKELKQQDVLDAVNLMQTTTTCLQKSKETYHQRCAEVDKLRREPTTNAKELSKLEAKQTKAREEYRGYVDKYEVVREDFQEKMLKATDVFQKHDRNHFATLQQFLLQYASHHQEASLSSQQVCGQLREALQQFNINGLLEAFAKASGTGSERPERIQFEEWEHGTAGSEFVSSLEPVTARPPKSEPSSCSSSSIVAPITTTPSTKVDLLSMDDHLGLNAWSSTALAAEGNKLDFHRQTSPTTSAGSDSTTSGAIGGGISQSVSAFSLSGTGGGTQKKLSSFLPGKRRKTVSQSSNGHESLEQPAGGLFKFRGNWRGKKSTDTLPDVSGTEDAQSTASSSRSDDKNGVSLMHPLDAPVENRRVDAEGYIIRDDDGNKERDDKGWSSCDSSDGEEDENEMQQSKIKTLTIRPADSARTINASVDELRDAIGQINLVKQSSVQDPWCVNGSKQPVFSQSMTGMKPLRPSHTADGRFRTDFPENDTSNSSFGFSSSMGPASGLARARPRSNTPTHNSAFGLQRQDSNPKGSSEWGSSFALPNSDSGYSIGESSFNLSQSMANLVQDTISEQRIPLAMAINEYSHAWFKAADLNERTLRTFGTVLISFASSSLPLLTDVHSDIEPLQFQLVDAEPIKAILPNKQLLIPASSLPQSSGTYAYSFDRLGLANWLLAQKNEKPNAAFYNAEVVRYEISDEKTKNEPPLFLTSYWKREPGHTGLRIDYRLNCDVPSQASLINIKFVTKLVGQVVSVTSDPSADWNAEKSTLTWSITELSRHGECGGSLKARAVLSDDSQVVPPAQTHVSFQSTDSSISGVTVSLPSSDVFHLSMLRKKVLAGKYFSEPVVHK